VKAVVLVLLLFTANANANLVQFLYIEANEGNSSGGHVALQLGDEIYHYQYENAFIRLFRHNAEAFRVDYQLRQNRTIHVADIAVTDSAYEQISRYFKVQFLAQKQRLEQLQALRQDQALMQALLQLQSGKPTVGSVESNDLPQLPGAGLFYNDAELSANTAANGCNTARASSKIMAEAKRQLEVRYGKDFLPDKLILLNQELGKLIPNNASYLAFPHYSFSEQYSDLLNGMLALQVLQENRALVNDACFQIQQPYMKLKVAAINQAQAFQQDLMRTVQALLVSNRPDWGYALSVTLARLVVLEQSIQARYWTFLDDTDATKAVIPSQHLKLYTEQLNKQRYSDLQHLQEAVSGLEANSTLPEQDFVNLEMAANRYRQWLESDTTGALRYQSEQPLPSKNAPISLFMFSSLSAGQLKTALHGAEVFAERLTRDDRHQNTYHLIGRNCVTALFQNLNEAVSGQSDQLLGGSIDPAMTLIPFQAFDSVQEAYNVINIRELPAYRRQELAKMYRREVDSWVYARESNIFSSSLYKHNPDDAWFMFFTDDSFLLRPLFGAVNTLAATSQSVFGLLSWPFDGGRDLKIGARGVVTSLPELAFFNIRKGSYPYPIQP
jgi:hypothetical protein